MNKRSTFFLLIAVVMSLLVSVVNADSGIRVNLDGKEVIFDQAPIIEDGRTLVPIRAITEALGAEVETNYNSDGIMTITITKGNEVTELTLGSNMASVNGVTTQLDVPANIVGGRTLVPLRFISEAFSLTVDWSDGVIEIGTSGAIIAEVANNGNNASVTQPITYYEYPDYLGVKSYDEVVKRASMPDDITEKDNTLSFVYSYDDENAKTNDVKAYKNYLLNEAGFTDITDYGDGNEDRSYFFNLDTDIMVAVAKLSAGDIAVVFHTSVEGTTEEEYTLGSTILHDGIEITFGNKVEFVTIENRYSDNNGDTVVKVPVTVKNVSNDTRGLNMFRYKVFGSKGTTVSTSVTAYFDEAVDYMGEMRPNASGRGYYYFLYDGNGDYYMSFSESFLDDPIEVRIPVKK